MLIINKELNNMEKIVFTEYSKDNAKLKRIAEIKKNIDLYKKEIKRWKQELAELQESK